MNHGHKPTILHCDKHGYVACCPGCMKFQLGFGNVYLNQNLEDLTAFAILINKHHHCHSQRRDRTRKDIFIDSPCQGFGILLTPFELEKINNILQKHF